MDTPSLGTLGTLGFGAGIAAIAAGWQQVKSVVARIVGLVVVSVMFNGGYAGRAASRFVRLKLKPTPTAFREYTGRIRFLRPRSRYGCVMFEGFGNDGRLFWRGWVPVWLVGSSKGSNDPRNDSIKFRFIRGTLDPDALAREVAECSAEDNGRNNTSKGSGFRIFRMAGISQKAAMSKSGQKSESPSAPDSGNVAATSSEDDPGRLVGWKLDDVGERITLSDPVERLALSGEVLDILEHIQRWFDSKDWYAERQIPWRFGVLFHGPPGTGKSSLTKAIAQRMEMPIYLMDISTMDNEEFHSAYRAALSNTPCIVLVEDIDAVFHGRKNVVSDDKSLTYDCFLNTISGVENSDGVLLVVTTNNIDKVDPALGIPQPGSVSSRPGRIDRSVEMPALDAGGRIKLAQRIMAGCHQSWVTYLATKGQKDTGAQFEDRCTTAALALYWSNNSQQPAPDFEAEAEAAA